VIVETIRRNGKGYNAATGEFGDLIAQGIVDPAKVTRSAVQSAASICGMGFYASRQYSPSLQAPGDTKSPRTQSRVRGLLSVWRYNAVEV